MTALKPSKVEKSHANIMPLKEQGIIQPFKKRRVNNDTCGINREKNPCGDASEY